MGLDNVFKDSLGIVWSHWKATFWHLWEVVAIWGCPCWLESGKSIYIQEGFREWQVSQSTLAPEGYGVNSIDFIFLGTWKTSWLETASLTGLIFFDQPVCLWGWDDCLDGWGESPVYSDYKTVLYMVSHSIFAIQVVNTGSTCIKLFRLPVGYGQ